MWDDTDLADCHFSPLIYASLFVSEQWLLAGLQVESAQLFLTAVSFLAGASEDPAVVWAVFVAAVDSFAAQWALCWSLQSLPAVNKETCLICICIQQRMSQKLSHHKLPFAPPPWKLSPLIFLYSAVLMQKLVLQELAFQKRRWG